MGFGLSVVDDTVALAVPVPGRVVNTVNVNCAVEPLVSAAAVQFTCPVFAGNFGTVHVHPDGALNETKCVFTGNAWVKVKFAASLGPLFVTVATSASVLPLTTVPGLAATVVTKFAPGSANGFTIPVYAYLCCK